MSSIPPTVADLFALDRQLRDDRDRRISEIVQRDRAIGKRLVSLRRKPVRQILAWLRDVTSESETDQSRRVEAGLRVVGFILTLIGLLIGWGTAAAVFYYDGSHPVNVVHVLAVFVGLQLLLLVLLLVTLCPKSWLSWLPGFSSLQQVLGFFSPGRLQGVIWRLMPQANRQSLEALLGRGKSFQRVFSAVQKWQIARWSQSFALAFNVGAISCCFYLVTFSDLAFSWSTTLQTQPEAFHRLTQTLSAPWAAWLPQAEPSPELIRETRYFRINAPSMGPNRSHSTPNPEILGGWWPFLVACLSFYGLLPRLLTWFFASWQRNRALRTTLLRIPGAADLLERLNRPAIDTRSPEPEAGPALRTDASVLPADPIASPGSGAPTVVWADLPFSQKAQATFVDKHLGTSMGETFRAGGAASLEDDARVIQALAEAAPTSIIVLIKAWEAPTLDLSDFITDLRAAVGDGVAIHVAPLGLGPPENPTLPAGSDCTQWQRLLSPLGDPWLQVHTYASESPS